MTDSHGTPTIGERQAIAEAIRKAKVEADKTYGIAWHHLEEISRVELIIAALATPTTNAPVAEQREAIARIVAPDVWRLIDHWRATANRPDLLQRIEEQSAPSLAQADAILSLTKNVATNADMRGALEAIDRIVEENIVENDRPDRVLWKGQWIDGAAAEMVHSLLRAMQRVARTVLQGDQS